MEDSPLVRSSREIMDRGLLDWVFLEEASGVVGAHLPGGTDEPTVRRETLSVLGRLLQEELIEAGDVTDAGFIPWDLSPRRLYTGSSPTGRSTLRWNALSETSRGSATPQRERR